MQILFSTALFPGRYIQGKGALRELPSLISHFGSRALMIASSSARKHLQPENRMETKNSIQEIIPFGGECSENELTRTRLAVEESGADVIVAMGGGKVIDTGKITADRAGIPVIVIPTIASSDAPCSGCAVVYTDEGTFDTVLHQKTNPAAVLVDTALIASAPYRFLVAGMGDALSTWFEARSCHATASENECGGMATMTGLHLARLCFDTLLTDGESALIATKAGIVTPALERIIEANTLLSGIGFESGGLASAHAIHNGLTVLEETHAFLHGEKVAFGTLAGLQLSDSLPEEIDTVYGFCQKVGLPTTLAEIGLGHCDRTRLLIAGQKACMQPSSMHKEKGCITPEKVLDALLAADALGRARKLEA